MAHSFRAHYYHIVWSTKGRRSSITPAIQAGLYAYIAGIIRKHQGTPLAIGGISNHIHLLIELKQSDRYSMMIKDIKRFSCHWVHKNFPESKAFAWQEGYSSFSMNYSGLNRVKAYIENQERHHEKLSFEDEYLKLLEQCEIKYDRQYALG